MPDSRGPTHSGVGSALPNPGNVGGSHYLARTTTSRLPASSSILGMAVTMPTTAASPGALMTQLSLPRSLSGGVGAA